MTTSDGFSKFGVFFGAVLVVLHIAKMVFTLNLVRTAAGEIIQAARWELAWLERRCGR